MQETRTSTATQVEPQILEEVSAVRKALAMSPYRQLRQLEADVEDGQVVLRGTVPSFFLKQMAQSVAAKATSDGIVSDHLEVT